VLKCNVYNWHVDWAGSVEWGLDKRLYTVPGWVCHQRRALRVISRPDARNTRFYSQKICYLWSFFDTAIGISASTSHSLIPARVDLDLFPWKIFIFQRQLRIKLMNFCNTPIKVKGLFFEL